MFSVISVKCTGEILSILLVNRRCANNATRHTYVVVRVMKNNADFPLKFANLPSD